MIANKKLLSLLLVCVVYLSGLTGFSQETKPCKVMVPAISGTYEGKCKKGFAHGKGTARGEDVYIGRFKYGFPEGEGTYTWANGDVYFGEFVEGKRNGSGTLRMRMGDADSVLTGLWEDDKYIGPIPEKPKVLTKFNVDRYTFQKNGNIQDRVLLDFYQNGARNRGIENMTLSASSGSVERRGLQVGYNHIIFPVEIKVSYITWNKMHTQKYNVTFEFRISEPGDWVVNIYN